MNQQGQEAAGFRLLIEAVLVVFILVIIIGVVNQVDSWRWKVSEQRLYEGFNKALNSPDASVIIEKGIVLRGGASYGSRGFSGSVTNLDHECIEMQASKSNAFDVSDNGRIININTLIQTDLFYQCMPGSYVGEDDCDTYCIVSFGNDLSEEDD